MDAASTGRGGSGADTGATATVESAALRLLGTEDDLIGSATLRVSLVVGVAAGGGADFGAGGGRRDCSIFHGEGVITVRSRGKAANLD